MWAGISCADRACVATVECFRAQCKRQRGSRRCYKLPESQLHCVTSYAPPMEESLELNGLRPDGKGSSRSDSIMLPQPLRSTRSRANCMVLAAPSSSHQGMPWPLHAQKTLGLLHASQCARCCSSRAHSSAVNSPVVERAQSLQLFMRSGGTVSAHCWSHSALFCSL